MRTHVTPTYHACGMENTYPDSDHLICPDCSHECSVIASKEESAEVRIHKDAHGNNLNEGDTKIKSIRLID